MFVRNQWYVASWDHEIDRLPFARTMPSITGLISSKWLGLELSDR